jgi:hypothetical protein
MFGRRRRRKALGDTDEPVVAVMATEKPVHGEEDSDRGESAGKDPDPPRRVRRGRHADAEPERRHDARERPARDRGSGRVRAWHRAQKTYGRRLMRLQKRRPLTLIEQALSWELAAAPILADCAYGDDSDFRTRLHALEREYVLAVSAQLSVYGPETTFAVPERSGSTGRPRTVVRPDRKPESVRALAGRLPKRAWQTRACRTAPGGEEIASRFAFVRVVVTHPVRTDCLPPRWEWLIIEWPQTENAPTDYWLSNLPETEGRERLARLARLRWTIELDYRQLKGELGLDHYEGRSYLGFHHHCALVTCAHAFLTLERLDPKARRPA